MQNSTLTALLVIEKRNYCLNPKVPLLTQLQGQNHVVLDSELSFSLHLIFICVFSKSLASVKYALGLCCTAWKVVWLREKARGPILKQSFANIIVGSHEGDTGTRERALEALNLRSSSSSTFVPLSSLGLSFLICENENRICSWSSFLTCIV